MKPNPPRMHGLTPFTQTDLGEQALTWIDRARSAVIGGLDAIPDLSAAIACLRAEAGEGEDLAEDEEPEPGGATSAWEHHHG
jgi:hypothetical protein